jgi:2-desacetyl-2-hydroxyethyl bacteriochlorophyllide A dehydrogenase
MAQYVAVDAEKTVPIPEDFSFELAALIEPTAVAVHAVRIADVKLDDTVVILGAGLIGTLTAQVVRLVGPREIIMTDIMDNRLALAEKLGFTTVNSARTDPVDEIMKLTSGKGADVVFEVTGKEATAVQMGKIARVRGEIVLVGMPKDPPRTDLLSISFKELSVKGVRVYAPFDFARAIDIASRGLVNLEYLISHRLTLDESPEGF